MRESATSVSLDHRAHAEWSARSWISILLTSLVASIAAALLVVGTLAAMSDAFRVGATASGLNPGGGGPGVLLMAPPAIAALLVARWCDQRAWLGGHAVPVTVAVLGGAVQGLVVLGLGGAVLPADFPSLESPASAAALAWAVPVAVMAILARL